MKTLIYINTSSNQYSKLYVCDKEIGILRKDSLTRKFFAIADHPEFRAQASSNIRRCNGKLFFKVIFIVK